ncbi:MAG: TonB family domain-containing protein [Candidatus Tokpelaia hoelldobleri]|uniref:TonB family domain-containing protein n=1 Tax=Candidatus Tokpelaia hoelldobleri TaxID=1902579 RepID=A0A1U9JW08_9HYPH|nr:MAG: TonB family domain-containing protein [Candidatus Tokpelaia hoelldoblerii]
MAKHMTNTGKQQKTIRWHWTVASCTVFCLYAGLGFALYNFYPEQEAPAGEPPALMLDFAEEITAPAIENPADIIRQAMVEKSEQQEEQVEETSPSDMREEEKPVEKKPEKPKPAQDKKRKHRRQDISQNDRRAQTASGAQIAAPRGDAYRAPRDSRTDGDNGRAVASWKNRVVHRIRSRVATMRGYSGSPVTVRVQFRFDRQGKITSADINASSGNARVDAHALREVRRISRIPAPPEGAEPVLTVPIKVEG